MGSCLSVPVSNMNSIKEIKEINEISEKIKEIKTTVLKIVGATLLINGKYFEKENDVKIIYVPYGRTSTDNEYFNIKDIDNIINKIFSDIEIQKILETELKSDCNKSEKIKIYNKCFWYIHKNIIKLENLNEETVEKLSLKYIMDSIYVSISNYK